MFRSSLKSAYEMTYTVSRGALNSVHSLVQIIIRNKETQTYVIKILH